MEVFLTILLFIFGIVAVYELVMLIKSLIKRSKAKKKPKGHDLEEEETTNED